MNYSKFMNVLNTTDYLLKYFAGFFLVHSFFANDVVEKLTPFHVFHDKKQMFGSFNNFIKLNNVGMPNKF